MPPGLVNLREETLHKNLVFAAAAMLSGIVISTCAMFWQATFIHSQDFHPGVVDSNLLEIIVVLARALPCKHISAELGHRFI